MDNHINYEEVKKEINLLKEKILHLENLMFSNGLMLRSPCFLCGYNGPGYFQSASHPCAERHHEFFEKTASNRLAKENRCVHRSVPCQCNCHIMSNDKNHGCCYPCKDCGFLSPA